jgi:hypothetical protein
MLPFRLFHNIRGFQLARPSNCAVDRTNIIGEAMLFVRWSRSIPQTSVIPLLESETA